MKQIIPALALSLALTVPMVSANDVQQYDVVLYSTSLAVNVVAFGVNGTNIPYTTSLYSSLSGSGSHFVNVDVANGAGGFRLTIAPNSQDGYYLISGLNPGTSNIAPSSLGGSVASGAATYMVNYYYILSSSTNFVYSNNTYGDTFTGLIFIPAHTQTLYFYGFCSARYPGFIYQSPSLIFYPSSSMSPDYTSLFNQVIAGITSLESALSRIENATTQLSPMGQFESDYLDHYQDQLQGVEGALSGDSSSSLGGLAPNGGDYVGFAEDLTDGFGFSSSHFSPSQFSEAVNSLSGSDAFDVGRPWEFFSQSIADALAGQGSSTYSIPGLPPDDFISDWVRDSELRRSRW